mmetsp:Transcript_30320/g.68367  ORF Transcript_30320/g.68367 Transcript_30320/m.68367 type:complete len:233 (-) Transcript_30320:1160-1858(-)
MILSTRPWMISNPLLGPVNVAQTRREFLAPTTVSETTHSESGRTTSLISKSLNPPAKLMDLLCWSVLRRPGRSVVRTTSYSTLAGLLSLTAAVTGRPRAVKLSAVLQRPCVRTSVYPALPISSRRRSPSWLSGCSLPTVHVPGTVRTMLLYPCAMPTSSATSTAWSMSDLVGGTVTSRTSSPVCPSGMILAGPSCMRLQRSAILDDSTLMPMRLLTKSTFAVSLRVYICGVT